MSETPATPTKKKSGRPVGAKDSYRRPPRAVQAKDIDPESEPVRKPRGKAGRPKGKTNSPKAADKAYTNRLTRELIHEFCGIVAQGNFRKTACQRLGIPLHIYAKWIQQGRESLDHWNSGAAGQLGRSPTAVSLPMEFVLRLDEAEGRMHSNILMDVLQSNSVGAKMWFLERRFRQQYMQDNAKKFDDESGREISVTTEEDANDVLLEKLQILLMRK